LVDESLYKNEYSNFGLVINQTSPEFVFITAINPQELANKYISLLLNLNKNKLSLGDLVYVSNDILTDDLSKYVIGFIQLDNLNLTIGSDCFDSWQTTSVAAEKGKGPLLYSIAASWAKKEGGIKNKITPHRKSVRPGAIEVWKQTYKHRNDFKTFKFDDKNNPKTPELFDDCDIYDTGILGLTKRDNFYLNFAYEIKAPINYEVFIVSFEQFINKLSEDMLEIFNTSDANIDLNKIKKHLTNFVSTRIGDTYFQQRYK
jgi:hypothetical protein